MFGRAEKSVAAFQQLSQVKLQTAAHRTNHVRLEFRVDEVLEIRQTIAGCHAEKQMCVGAVPIEIRRHVVCWDWECKYTALSVAFKHDLNIRTVDHVHFFLELTVREINFFSADQRMLIAKVLRADPVKRQVCKRSLCTPAARDIQVVNKFLNALTDFLVIKVVDADERGEVGVKRAESLSTGPFILHGAEEINDLSNSTG